MPHRKRVIVIGAGVGGLSAAIELAASGCDVTVIERAHAPGGKMRQVVVGDSRMDAGPTVFTMRWVFEELFDLAGTSLDAELKLTRAEVLARHAWDGCGSTYLDLFADPEQSAAAIEAFSGRGEGKRFLAFVAAARGVYTTLKNSFIRNSKTNPLGLVERMRREGKLTLGSYGQLSPYTSLWHALGRHLRDPRLQQLFGRYATYTGSSPFLAPATLMLIAYVEQEGVWLLQGGMHRLAVTLAELAVRHGAALRYDADVAEILTDGRRAVGVRLTGDDARLDADAIVLNADISSLGHGLFGKAVTNAVKPTLPEQRSLSALTWNIVGRTSGFPLNHHSVFFSNAYAAEFDDIFKHHRLPQGPTVYICAQDRGADLDAAPPAGPERLLVLVNAPPIGDGAGLADADIERCYAGTVALLERCGLAIEHAPDACVATDPSGFERLFPATGGALYGRASHGSQASFSRPGARSKVPGLYLAGGSTHPGAGIPMAALSARQAVKSVLEDFGAPALR
jgi:1-hydroxycarotenoid 3,4-desaturase